VTDRPLRCFVVQPFNIYHAMTAELLRREVQQRDPGDRRDVVKEDMKLIAQAICESVTHVLTEDERTIAMYVWRLNGSGQSSLRVVLLANGFDVSWFNNGQHRLLDDQPQT